LAKRLVVIKSPKAKVPSNFIRTKYIEFDESFQENFANYLDATIGQAEHYEIVADQLDRNLILAVDYLRRAFLITGDKRLRAKAVIKSAGFLQFRAASREQR
jgi:hypothetical protein